MHSPSFRALVRAVHTRAIVLLLVAAGYARAEGAAQLRDAAERLLPLLDLECKEMAAVKRFAAKGDKVEALRTWRDLLVARMRRRDYHQFYQHDYSRHPRQVGVADMLAGVVSQEAYLRDASKTGFLDIFGMAGRPDRAHRVNWFAQPEDVADWGNSEINAWSLQKKRSKIGYGCLHFGRSFVARFWETGNPAYRDKAMQLMDDFVLNHYRLFWEAYARGEVHTRNREVGKLYYSDWRHNVNALDTSVRARNFVVFQAGLAKCLGDRKPADWADILSPIESQVTRAQAEALPADQMANIAVSLIERHGPKIIRFVSGPCVPNQRLAGLKALLCLSATYPGFRHSSTLLTAFRINIAKVLEDNYLPDGGSLEQSFNYNRGELRELELILAAFGDEVPPFAEELRKRVQARRAMDDGLRTPLGGLPQVGNHSSVTSTGKDVWSSPAAADAYRAYRKSKGQLAHPEPQPYLSRGYPYSGYFAMRGGWGMTDPYLFFMAGRLQSGHHMHDANSIQIVVHGRNLVVCDGAPTYGFRHTPEAEYAAAAVDEQCGWKVNTVLVDGKCQARDARRYGRAPQTPVRCRWHTSERFDVIENQCDRGYWQAQKPHGKPDHSVAHVRTVVFVRSAGSWLMEDRMIRRDDASHTYAQTWNFAPKIEHKDYARRHIDGFEPDQFELQPEQKRFATADPGGPNLEFHHVTLGPVTYRKYYGDREGLKGWFAPGLGSVCAAPDIHAEWQSADSDRLVTLLIPRAKGGPSPIAQLKRVSGDGWFGVDCELRTGGWLSYRTAASPRNLSIGDISATATSLLVQSSPQRAAGVVGGASALSVAGRTVKLVDGYAEFSVRANGAADTVPIPLQRSPLIEDHPPFLAAEPVPPVVITGEEGFEVRYTLDGREPASDSPLYTGPLTLAAPATVKARYFRGASALPFTATREYRRVFYPARPADHPLHESLEQGLHCADIHHRPGIRIYDLMLQKPVREFDRATWRLEDFAKRTNYGLKQTCLIRIPKRGFWHFHLKRGQTATAAIVVCNPATDLPAGPITSVGWWAEERTGSIALEVGYHCLEIQYGCFYNRRNGLDIEIEGPGTPRQPLPDTWLFRRRSQ